MKIIFKSINYRLKINDLTQYLNKNATTHLNELFNWYSYQKFYQSYSLPYKFIRSNSCFIKLSNIFILFYRNIYMEMYMQDNYSSIKIFYQVQCIVEKNFKVQSMQYFILFLLKKYFLLLGDTSYTEVS